MLQSLGKTSAAAKDFCTSECAPTLPGGNATPPPPARLPSSTADNCGASKWAKHLSSFSFKKLLQHDFSVEGLLPLLSHACPDKMETPARGFCLVVEVGYNFWLLSQEKLLFSLSHLYNIMQHLWTAATVSLANGQINISNHIVLRSSRKPTASLSSWPSH